MAIKDFGKGLKSSLHDAVDTVKAKAKEVELPDIKEAGEKTSERIKSIFKKTDGDKPSNEAIAPTQNITSISARSAIKVIYFLMAADGEIYHGEESKHMLPSSWMGGSHLTILSTVVRTGLCSMFAVNWTTLFENCWVCFCSTEGNWRESKNLSKISRYFRI